MQHLLTSAGRACLLALAAITLCTAIGAAPAATSATGTTTTATPPRTPVASRIITLYVPAIPPMRTQLYCCDGNGCYPVSSLGVCLPQDIKMACDQDGLCMPINALSSTASNWLRSQ